jgi:hypothetical protein
LNVLKIQDNEVTILWTDYFGNIIRGLSGRAHGRRASWQNNYLIFAENRPLNTLYQMVDTPESQIGFSRSDFELQFDLYYRELKRLIEDDLECRDMIELFKYKDYTRRRPGNFTNKMKELIKKMKMI